MNIKLTFINKDIENYSENNVIIEKDNGDRILTKYNEELEKLLSQEIIVDNIKHEIINNNKEIENKKNDIKHNKSLRKKFLFSSILIPIVMLILIRFIGPDPIINTRGGLMHVSIAYTKVTATVIAFINVLVTYDGKKQIKKNKNILKSLAAQNNYLNDQYNTENKKLEDLKINVNNKNNTKLKSKIISPKDELEKIKEEAKFYYERGYYTENKKSENTKEKNKQLLKRKDDNNG